MAFCIALLLFGVKDTAVAQPQNAREVVVTFHDANPRFLNVAKLPVPAREVGEFASRVEKSPRRSGLAADGVTRVAVQVELPAPGLVNLLVAGDEPLGKLEAAVDGDTLKQIATRRLGQRHLAWAILTAPDEFGPKYAGKDSRDLTLKIEFTPAAGQLVRHEAKLKLVRPPVVLVHGTYHGPKQGWATPPPKEIGDRTMVQHLKDRGFEVFLCDYEKSNGNRSGGPSHLRDNQKVVWENPGGIRDALEAFRKREVAVTQADVVGHSMGGTLARVYARGQPMPEREKPAGGGEVQESKRTVDDIPQGGAGDEDRPTRSTGYPAELRTTNWYLRNDNFARGDIHRLITICTPHFGSQIVHLVGLYPECCGRVPPEIGASPKAKALLQIVDMAHGTQTGAFFDQAPLSAALCAIGPTRIPCHAIAGVAAPADFGQFHELYRWNFLTLYLNAPAELIEQLFTHEKVKQQEDAQRLVAFLKEHRHLLNGIAVRAAAANMGRPASALDPKIEEQYTQALTLFCSAVFCGQPHDGTVTKTSAHGGLASEQFCSTLEGVVHSFAARYPHVQKRVSDLLEGPAENFAGEGFPAVQSAAGKTNGKVAD